MSEMLIAEDLRVAYAHSKAAGDYSVMTLIERISRVEAERDEWKERLERIADWCDVYPLEVFPMPNLDADRKLLGDSEFSRLNANSMRHVVEGIKKIAAALEVK